MIIKFKELWIRNFLSYGNNLTKLKLDFTKPTLVVGRNYDSIVNGLIDSNGAGKTAILNALCVCLYDKSISQIEKAEWVNYINDKNMEITVIFEINGVHYKVERYRKNKAKGGDGVRFFVNPKEAVFDEKHDKSRDSGRNITEMIAETIGIPYEIFSRIIIFSAGYEPFLSLPSSHASKANQRDIIEEIFGLVELTTKAELLKKEISATKKELDGVITKNDRIASERARFEAQIGATVAKESTWNDDKKSSMTDIKTKLKSFAKLDFEEISEVLDKTEALQAEITSLTQELRLFDVELKNAKADNDRHDSWILTNKIDISVATEELEALEKIDIAYLTEVQEIRSTQTAALGIVTTKIRTVERQITEVKGKISKLEEEIQHLSGNLCPYCKQSFKESKDKIVVEQEKLNGEQDELLALNIELDAAIESKNKITKELDKVAGIDIPANLKGIADSIIRKTAELASLKAAVNPYTLKETDGIVKKIDSAMDSIEEKKTKVQDLLKSTSSDPVDYGLSVWTRSDLERIGSEMERLADKLETLLSDVNPFTSIVKELQFSLDNEIETVDTDKADNLDSLLTHQEFLLKLLTKKDSFVRKALLNKNIPFLNARLTHYLNLSGLEHKVKFNEEMGVDITKFGTRWQYANLSSGQKARVNLALSFAFRDVLQARFSKVNFCILDECLDTGLGNVGVQLATKMIKGIAAQDNLSMFVISHKDEIANMFDEKLEVELREGFSKVVSGKALIVEEAEEA